jgi:hypothetical protein
MAMKHSGRGWALVAAMVLVASWTATAWSQVSGRQRIELVSGRYVEGDVTELPDGSYEVKTKQGVVLTIKKSEVRAMYPVDSAAGKDKGDGAESTERRSISDAEINELLAGITTELDEGKAGVGTAAMAADLSLDEDSLAEMLKESGADRDKNVLVMPHFVMVYTSSEESAKKLGTRLEAVWRWNMRFMDMLNLPVHRPEHKLELYYFGTRDEFDRYSRNRGSELAPGILGYYHPDYNRSHFFDLTTFPLFQRELERVKQPGVSWQERQRVTNKTLREVEKENLEVIQHEIGHHIHFSIGLFPKSGFRSDSPLPRWLVEGTTMMFEVPPTTEGASLGLLNHTRLYQVRASFGVHPLNPTILKDFLLSDMLWFRGPWGMGRSYPLGWSLVYYLFKEHREGYAKYIRAVYNRDERMSEADIQTQLEDCVGKLDEKWFKSYYAFLDRLELRPSLVPPDDEEAARAQNLARHNQPPSAKTDTSKPKSTNPPAGGKGGTGGSGGKGGKGGH